KGLDARAAELDLLKPETIRRELAAVKPAVVVHLAGLSTLAQCIQAGPEQALRTNRDGTRAVAEELARAGGKRLVFASTAQVYQGAHEDEVKSGVVFSEDRK